MNTRSLTTEPKRRDHRRLKSLVEVASRDPEATREGGGSVTLIFTLRDSQQSGERIPLRHPTPHRGPLSGPAEQPYMPAMAT